MNQRIKSCLELLSKYKLDAVLISAPANIKYLTAHSQPWGYVLICPKQKPIYFTSFLYQEELNSFSNFEIIVSRAGEDIFNTITKTVKKSGLNKIGFESRDLSIAEHQALEQRFEKSGIKLVATTNFIERIRAIKEPAEIKKIKQSIAMTKEALACVAEIFSPTMSEKDLSIEVERFLRLRGDNSVAFNCIVARGKNTVYPHHQPGKSKIGKEFFIIDLGSKCYEYCADLTRVFFWSKMPLLFKKIYATVKKAQELSIQRIKDGAKASSVDKAARDYIESKGWGKYFGHGVGHGVGLEVHEQPFLSPGNNQILKQGMVVTIEPAIYFKDKFGIRIEDMILVKKNKGEILSGDIAR